MGAVIIPEIKNLNFYFDIKNIKAISNHNKPKV